MQCCNNDCIEMLMPAKGLPSDGSYARAETGWYDGQVWVKTPQILMRDRLLNNYTIMPAMQRIRRSLVASSAACVLSVAALQTNDANAAERSAALSKADTVALTNTKCAAPPTRALYHVLPSYHHSFPDRARA